MFAGGAERPRICCAGEAMVEFIPQPNLAEYAQSFGGDSLNTAVYLARLDCAVQYLTIVGDDGFSGALLALLDAEEIDRSRVIRRDHATLGLYVIKNDEQGERSFTYWRDTSPARGLFDAAVSCDGIDVFYFTGITVAVCLSGLVNLLDLLRALRGQGVRIAFDPNYREALWRDSRQAQEAMGHVLPLCDLVMPTLDDMRALYDCETAPECEKLLRGHRVREIVVKGGDGRVNVLVDAANYSGQATMQAAIDTTGAGDAFNAGYLAGRSRGLTVDDCIAMGHATAAQVVLHPGAIVPKEGFTMRINQDD
ncbi:MAG: sugar kinase [Pseudomonadales bacterium]